MCVCVSVYLRKGNWECAWGVQMQLDEVGRASARTLDEHRDTPRIQKTVGEAHKGAEKRASSRQAHECIDTGMNFPMSPWQ